MGDFERFLTDDEEVKALDAAAEAALERRLHCMAECAHDINRAGLLTEDVAEMFEKIRGVILEARVVLGSEDRIRIAAERGIIDDDGDV